MMRVPVGVGVGWKAFDVGGDAAGFHNLHLQNWFFAGFAGVNLF